jgi:hypothetical protein
MINLVFSYAIQFDPLVEVMNDLPDRMRTLRSKQSVEIFGSKCPGLVRTRSVYMVEVLKFMLTHLTDAQTVSEIAGKLPIPSHFGRISPLLLPLWLFSHVMEARCSILGEVIPATHEVQRKSSEIHNFFEDQAIVIEALHMLTAYFLARLPRNSFTIILTAFALTPRGHAQIRVM